MTQRRNGTAVRDLTTLQTETGNVHVLAPVPASVKTAIKVTAELPHEVIAKQEAAIDKSIPTPRLGAHPDLTGNYSRTDWIGNYMTGGGRRCVPTEDPDCNRQDNQTYDFERALEATYLGPGVGPLGGRYTGDRLRLLRRFNMAGTGRFFPFREHACCGEIHAPGRRRRSFSGTRRLRSLRNQRYRLADSALGKRQESACPNRTTALDSSHSMSTELC